MLQEKLEDILTMFKKMTHKELESPTFYFYIVIVIGLILFVGLMANLGVMSLNLVDLEVF